MSDTLEPLAAAHLLRELSGELRIAEGAARNGLFLELHRLLDTIFRLTLASHPDLPPELHGAAFNLENPLPAPQVVRELNRLGTPLATVQIRALYKHMNMARNNMAHEPVIARVVISNSNVKRMAELATLAADVLDPERMALPDGEGDAPPRTALSRARLFLLLGVLAGIIGALAWQSRDSPLIMAGLLVVAAALIIGAWYFGE